MQSCHKGAGVYVTHRNDKGHIIAKVNSRSHQKSLTNYLLKVTDELWPGYEYLLVSDWVIFVGSKSGKLVVANSRQLNILAINNTNYFYW